MFAGVIRDEARQAAKLAERQAREKDFQDQIRRRMYLEQLQTVSNPSPNSSPLDGTQKLEPMDPVEFQGCKTC